MPTTASLSESDPVPLGRHSARAEPKQPKARGATEKDLVAAYHTALLAYEQACIRACDVAVRIRMGSAALQKWWHADWVAENADAAPPPYDPIRSSAIALDADDPAHLEVESLPPDEPIRSKSDTTFYGGDWPTARDVQTALAAVFETLASAEQAHGRISVGRAIAPPTLPETIAQRDMDRRGL